MWISSLHQQVFSYLGFKSTDKFARVRGVLLVAPFLPLERLQVGRGVAEDRLGLGHYGLEHVDAEAAEEAEVRAGVSGVESDTVDVVAPCRRRCCHWRRGCCLLFRFHNTHYYSSMCAWWYLGFELRMGLGLAFYGVFCGVWTGLCTNRFKPVCRTRAQNATVRPAFLVHSHNTNSNGPRGPKTQRFVAFS